MKWKSLSCVRLLRCYGLNSPCSFPGQNTGVGSLTLLGIFPTQRSNPGLPHYMWIFYQLSHKRSPSNKRVVVVKSLSHVRLFVTPWTLCSLPGFSLHGIFQAWVLEWVAISFSRGSSRPSDRTQVSHIAGRSFNLWATREAPKVPYNYSFCFPTKECTKLKNKNCTVLFCFHFLSSLYSSYFIVNN